MLFPSKAKVERRVVDLMRELEQIDGRIKGYEDQQKIFGGILGPAPEIAEMREARDGVYVMLGEGLLGLEAGLLDFRIIATQLKPLSGAIAHMRSILDQADADSAKAKAAFKAKYGN